MAESSRPFYIASQYEQMERPMSPSEAKAEIGHSAEILRTWGAGLAADALSYAIDATQRSILFMDVLRQRGDILAFHSAPAAQGGTGAVRVLLARR